MSGICGIVRLDGLPVSRRELDAMADAIAHRRPDPLACPEGTLVVTADARLDNRAELSAALGAPRSAGDGELILAAYERWGEDCPARLLGDFAFALWDGNRRRLFCARDHFGVKPLYYHSSDRLLAFGSELKALLALEEVPRRLDEDALAAFLASDLEDRARTFYRDIRRVPAAHSLTLDAAGLRLRRYWSLDPGRSLDLASDREYEEAFRETFLEAVRCRLRGGPVGSLLSGGLDSSAIACAARAELAGRGERLHSFTATFAGVPESDERAFAEAVLAAGGIDGHMVAADALSPLAELDLALRYAGEPLYAPNLYVHLALYGAAAQARVRVLLDGLDGDTTVSHGLARLTELARRGRPVALGRELALLRSRSGLPAGRLLRHRVAGPLVAEPLRRVLGRPAALPAHVPMDSRPLGRPARPMTARDEHIARLESGALQAVLEVTDRCAAPYSIEPRYPFFDVRLAELCLALPADQKLRDGWTRSIMRRSLAGILPEPVRWRPGKSDLGPAFARLLAARDGRLLGDVAARLPAPLRGIADVAKLEAAYGRLVAAVEPGEDDALALWKAAVLARWLDLSGFSGAAAEPMNGTAPWTT